MPKEKCIPNSSKGIIEVQAQEFKNVGSKVFFGSKGLIGAQKSHIISMGLKILQHILVLLELKIN